MQQNAITIVETRQDEAGEGVRRTKHEQLERSNTSDDI